MNSRSYFKPLTIIIGLIMVFTVNKITALPQASEVVLKVDLTAEQGKMDPAWAWFGYDEPNYTYMKYGQKLLSEISALSPVPVYVRTHNLLTSGDGSASLKWGSTNVYTEDSKGNPIYDWTIVDKIFDTYYWSDAKDGALSLSLTLQRQGVSLFMITW